MVTKVKQILHTPVIDLNGTCCLQLDGLITELMHRGCDLEDVVDLVAQLRELSGLSWFPGFAVIM